MQLHELKPLHSRKKEKRIGRGGKKGTYSGRGMKGQLARAGARLKPAIRELVKRYPKIRGYKFQVSNDSVVVNLSRIQNVFQEGETVSPAALLKKHIIRTIQGRLPIVKILGKGTIGKALLIQGCGVSKSARQQIEKAGGKILSP